MSFIPINIKEIRENYKKYLAIMILLFIYLFLPILSIIVIYLLIYVGYLWLKIKNPLILSELIMNILLTILTITFTYILMRLIKWIRE